MSGFEDFVFDLSDCVEHHGCGFHVDLAAVSQVVADLVDDLLVDVDESIDGAFANLQRRQMRQEIVAHEETQENLNRNSLIKAYMYAHEWERGRKRNVGMRSLAKYSHNTEHT